MSIPTHLRQDIADKIEGERLNYRDMGDTINRLVVHEFLACNRDFGQTRANLAPVLDNLGIPRQDHTAYIKQCLKHCARQAGALKTASKKGKPFVPPTRCSEWHPVPQQTDYTKTDTEAERQAIPHAPDLKCMSGDSLSIDKDWNLMSEFEREEEETKAMLRDI